MSTERREYEIQVPAKWVLSGEHAVLRGGLAVVFPHDQFRLSLKYREKADREEDSGQEIYRNLFLRALNLLGARRDFGSLGKIEIHSTIPQGAGLGSSAALCVAMARLAVWYTHSDPNLHIPLATQLEDGFHGKSSGMDVNATAHAKPILFSMKDGATPLEGLTRMPNFRVTDSGFRGKTRECIDRVLAWRERSSEFKEPMDQQMQHATELAVTGLNDYSEGSNEGLHLLQESMTLSQNCFETWGLITPELLIQKQDLLKRGALAVRLTGAGLGGFWVSLWKDPAVGLDNSDSGTII